MSNSHVFALKDPSTAYLAGSGAGLTGNAAELYKNGAFNGDVLRDIKKKIFGNAAVTQTEMQNYIKENGKEEFETYNTGSYVVKAPTINAAVGNETNGMIIRLGGIDWMVVSMTLANEAVLNDGATDASKKDNVILTLYQADDLKVNNAVIRSTYYGKVTMPNGAEDENMYSHSRLRKNITEAQADYSAYAMFASGDFAKEYLVQPQYITYQGKETQVDRDTPYEGNYHMPNESYNAFPDGWYQGTGDNSFRGYTDSSHRPTTSLVYNEPPRYDAWKEDYIWIPSATETGWNNLYLTKNSIWNLTSAQRAHTHNYTWLRSGMATKYYGACVIDAVGQWQFYNVGHEDNGVRPAIHFNLSAAYSAPKAKDPTDVETTYDGTEQTLDEIAATANKPAWYDEKYTNGYLNVEHLQTGKDAGEYWVKVSITDAWKDAVKQELLAEDPTLTEEQIQKLLPSFAGTAGTAPPGMEETDTIRYFKIKIIPKELSVNTPTYDNVAGVVNVSYADIDNELCGSDTAPKLGLHYTGAYSYDEINIMPWKKGTYTAKAILLNADNTAYSGNYVIANAKDMTCSFTLEAGKISTLQFDKTSKDYTGSVVDFVLTGYSADAYANVQMTWGGVTLVGDDAKGYTLQVKDVGTYTIKATLTDKANFTWSDGKTDDKTYKIEVTEKKVSISLAFNPSLGAGNTFQYGTGVTATATTDGFVSGEDVALNLTCGTLSGVGSLNLSTLAVGNHSISVALSGKNSGNYVIDGTSSGDVAVVAKAISVDNLDWLYAQGGGTPAALPSGGVTYNEKPFTFTIDTDTLPEGVDVSNVAYTGNVQTDAKKYSVSVTLTAADNYAFYESGVPKATKQLTQEITINKADWTDFSAVKWGVGDKEYTEAFEYNASFHEIRIISGLPDFLTPSYEDNSKKDVGDYEAYVYTFGTTNDNYNTPDPTKFEKLRFKWSIAKRKISNPNWTKDKAPVAGAEFLVPVLDVVSNLKSAIKYTYYTDKDLTSEISLQAIADDVANNPAVELTYYVKATLTASGGSYNATNCQFLDADGIEVEYFSTMFKIGENKNIVEIKYASEGGVTFNGEEQDAKFEVVDDILPDTDFELSYTDLSGSPITGKPINVGKYIVTISLNKSGYELIGNTQFEYEILPLKIAKPTFDGEYIFNTTGYDFIDVTGLPADWAKYFDITIRYSAGELAPVDGNWTFVNASDYHIDICFKDGMNSGTVGCTDNVIWSDGDTDDYFPVLNIKKKVFVVSGWTPQTGTKLPTPNTDNLAELTAYFDIEVKDAGDNVVSGKLKPLTDYKVSLVPKADYVGNVAILYEDATEATEKTPPYSFKTGESSGTDPDNPGGGDGDGTGGDGTGGDGTGGDGTGGDGTGGDGTGGDGSGNGNNNGNGTGSANPFGDGSLIWLWLFLGVLLLLILIMLIILVVVLLLRRGKGPEAAAAPAPQPIIYYNGLTPEQLAQVGGVNGIPQLGGCAPLQLQNTDISGENIWNGKYGANNIIPVNEHTMTPDDWTFMISEKDVANPDVLAQSNGNFVLYAVNKDDLTSFKNMDGDKVAANKEKIADDMFKAIGKNMQGEIAEVEAEKVDDDMKDKK